MLNQFWEQKCVKINKIKKYMSNKFVCKKYKYVQLYKL